jgi:CheY-like chemotaxis protein
MLNGRTALVVEEEFLIALDMQRMLEAFGAGQTVFARGPAEAMVMWPHWQQSGVALVEWRLDDEATTSLVESLDTAGIPLVFLTSGPAVRPPENRPVVSKPVREQALASALEMALALRH